MPELTDAREFVGTTPMSGLAQLLLLLRAGLTPSDTVLEIGCGALHLAKPLLAYLSPSWRYAGIDPNPWLRDVARAADPMLDLLCAGARFSSDDGFVGEDLGPGRFDFVFSHSVLSHASYDQLQRCLHAIAERLEPDGRALVSLNLSGRSGCGLARDEWVYPDCVEFPPGIVRNAVDAAGLVGTIDGESQRLYQSFCPPEVHDWLVLRHAEADERL